MTSQTIIKSLNLAYRKLKVTRSNLNIFRQLLTNLLTQTQANVKESEEFHKNNLKEFLKESFDQNNHYLNTKDKDDLVIYQGKNTDSKVAVIIETKSPNNKGEMLTFNKFNNKALQQLLYYYLQERIVNKNIELKQLIVTNIYDWFVFPASLFERLFYQDKSLVKQFNDFQSGKLISNKTNLFYQEIAQIFIAKVENELKKEVVYFNLLDYQQKDELDLVLLYKFLSPQHLLNLSFANDSNNLDQSFYNELLHIIGLTEVKEKGKKLIQRLPENQRFHGSLLENTITQLETYNKLDNVDNLQDYGEDKQTQLFHVALELVITWVNRILFLKLLEAQLINYNQQDENFAFLNLDRIRNYNDLDLLFFQVLAKKKEERNPDIAEKFDHVPYLNSSLFEVTILENQTIPMGSLNFGDELPFYSITILKDAQGKRKKGQLNTLHYLFDFLSAYDFSSDTSEAIQEENKTLINASVLGLIFEKINGYQDGSFFTPGFITMYMCRETIHRAVIHKFNEVKGWSCQNIDELADKIEDIKEANSIINNIKICDPAVGSGHFLVSALNEIIALKSYLNILVDKNGKKIKKIDYTIKVVNDELIVTDEDGKIFSYNPKNSESQRIQEALFHEKQTIIENCLFGVDININSVKICRLRLWIELLKNAYYTSPPQPPSPKSEGGDRDNLLSHQFPSPNGRGVRGEGKTLETLPNIDINIKCGNSLISRFDLQELILSPKIKQQIAEFKQAVKIYRNPKTKEEKREAIKKIEEIKSSFSTVITANDEDDKKLRSLQGELNNLVSQTSLFEETTKEKKVKEKKQKQLEKEINLLTTKIDDKKNNRIYRGGFEWRFEFPDVLNNEGNFIGFDVVIGNPPYGVKLTESQQFLLNDIYSFGTTETAILFILKGYHLLNKNGIQSYIIPKSFTFASNYQNIREFTVKEIFNIVDCGKVWQDVKLEVCIFALEKNLVNKNYLSSKRFGEKIKYLTTIDKTLVEEFNFFLNGLTVDEINLGLKIKNSCRFLNDVCQNQRGAMVQKLVKNEGDSLVIGGAQVQKYGVKGFKGKINKSIVNDDKAFIKVNSILVQNIIAHIQYPIDHILITASIPDNSNYILLDTINQLILNQDILPEFIWALLHSKLINWYVYCFIFAKAIRTMHFDNQVTGKIPMVKKIDLTIQKSFKKLVEKILKSKEENPNNDPSTLEREIDLLVYQLYGLTEEEIKLIEGEF